MVLPENEDPDISKIGKRIRELRTTKEWTLEDLATHSRLSKSFLSQVERGQSTLSIVSLSSICKALDVSMTELLQRDQALAVKEKNKATGLTFVPTALQLCFKFANSSVNYFHVIGHVHERAFDVIICDIPPGYSYPVMTHEGDEFGYLLEGTIHVKTRETDYSMKPGDCYYLRSTEPHSYETSKEKGAKILMVTGQRFLEWETVVKSTLLQFEKEGAQKKSLLEHAISEDI